mgnify:CR=1 FL=1
MAAGITLKGVARLARKSQSPDYTLFLTVLTLLAIGIVMVFSSSAVEALRDYGDMYYFLKRQLAWAFIGITAMVFLMNLDYWHIQRLAVPMLVVTLFLLVLVLVPGIGRASHGATRWLGYGSLAFQPSETMKLAFVIFLADYLARKQQQVANLFKGLGPILVLLGFTFILILAQPDLGTAVAIAGTVYVMLFVGGARLWHLLLLAVAAIPAMAVAIASEEYRLRRFLAFLNPFKDPLGSGYHIIQSLYALGSGGFFGLGLGQSRQKFLYLPERHTDFIFAILGEELGFIGAAMVVILFFLFAWRGYKTAITAPDTFSSLLAAGVTTMVALQAFVNIGVVTATLPVTGIPLPFLSFGGSSLVFTMMGVGALLNVSRYCRR